ncbi:MAG: DUF3748 domain-containing protein [Pirellulaceae bacterium]
MKRDYKRVPQLRKGTSGQIRRNGKSAAVRIPLFIVLILQGQALNAAEKQLTFAADGHILTNIGVWSPDSQWIYYDIRSDHAGANFDGNRIERVHVGTRETQTIYTSHHGACCGVVTVSPVEDRIVFIHGPEHPTDDWSYSAYHRRGVLVAATEFGTNRSANLDARNIVSPFTPGALRGGTHVHTFSGDGQWVAFTYEDHVLANRDLDTDSPARRKQISAT